jgi:glucan biosynthesis protein C
MRTAELRAPGLGEGTKRLAYLDNLRSLVIFLVVVMHSNVTYSGLGSWYYVEGDPNKLSVFSTLVFALYGSFTQAWFMGLLFFIAAYFVAKSLAKRGPAIFVKERLFRLGIPLLIYMFVIDPFISVVIMHHVDLRGPVGVGQLFIRYLTSFEWVGATGPLWFVEALLIFCLLYAAGRAIRPAKDVTAPPPRARTIVLIILATGLAAFAIRIFQPIGTSVANLQLCYFASYGALFLLGLHAGERKWLEAYPEKTGIRWFTVVLCAGLPLWLVVVGSGATLIYGGLRWQSLAYALWEAFVAIGFSVGLIAFFRKFLNVENAFTRLLARNSFAVYMFHAPILISISLLLKSWQAPFLVKHIAVAPLAFAATLAFSYLVLHRIPGLKAVVK